MAAGVTTKLWSLTDMLRVIEDWEARRGPRLADRLVGCVAAGFSGAGMNPTIWRQARRLLDHLIGAGED
jgi:hypothetical protein